MHVRGNWDVTARIMGDPEFDRCISDISADNNDLKISKGLGFVSYDNDKIKYHYFPECKEFPKEIVEKVFQDGARDLKESYDGTNSK